MSEGERESRRGFLKYVITGVVCGVVAGVGGWFTGSAAVPPPTTVTKTVTSTTTAPAPGAVTITKIKTETLTQTKTVTAAPKPPRTIKIGNTAHLTGVMAPVISPAAKMMETWAEMINERGGLYVREYGTRLPVEVIIYDDASDIDTAVKYYEKLITEDKVDVLIGPYLSDFSLACSTVAEKYGVPYVEGPANAREIHNRGYYWLLSQIDIMDYWLTYFFEYLTWEGKVKTLAAIYTDLAYSISVNRGMIKFAEEAGIDVVYNEKVPVMATDFSATISKLKALDPDQIIFTTPIATADVVFQKQVYELGYRPPALHHNCDGMLKAFQEPVGALGEYVTGEQYWDRKSFKFDGVWGKQFYLELMERAGYTNEDYPWVTVFFLSIEHVASGIEHAGSLDKKKIIEALHNLNIMTISGPSYIRDYEDVKYVSTIKPFPSQMINGVREVFWPREVATIRKRIYPIPWEKIEEKLGKK